MEITGGLSPGERYADDNSFLVKAELAKQMGDYPFYFGDEVEKTFFGAADLRPEVRDWIIEFLQKHGAKL